MENIFFLILVAVVGLLRWLSQAAENKRNAEAEKRGAAPTSAVPAPRSAPQTEEERVRKFFEALGVPTSNAPLPRVQPRQVAAKPTDRKFMPVDPFPVPRGRVSPLPPPVAITPPPLPVGPVPAVAVPQTLPIRSPKSTTSPEFAVHELGHDEQAQSDASVAALLDRLVTAQGLRDAIILREIFGPPRSMQPLVRTMGG